MPNSQPLIHHNVVLTIASPDDPWSWPWANMLPDGTSFRLMSSQPIEADEPMARASGLLIPAHRTPIEDSAARYQFNTAW